MGVRNQSQYQVPEFESFERFVIEWLSRRDVAQLDFIFRPQHCFLTDSQGNRIVDFVGKFEDISVDIANVESRLGKKIVLPHANATSASGEYASSYKSQEMIDLVAQVYQEDIRMFNYDF
jgi:hypothetical protein